ncbi:MAG: hypothetical protein IKP46_02005 [Bacteroidales bacterium]|nr:hypothetical protein [Bacteroidales bacterium]
MKGRILIYPLLLLISSCTEEIVSTEDSSSQGEPQNNPKELTITAEAVNVTEWSATLMAYANPTPEMGAIEMGVLYSTEEDPSLDNSTKLTSVELDPENKYKVSATGLASETTYYYKSFVFYGGVYRYGNVKSFTTKKISVDIVTGDPTDLHELQATLNGYFKVNSSENLTVEEVCFIYQSTGQDGTTVESLLEKGTRKAVDPREDGSMKYVMPRMMPGTTWSYMAYVKVHDKEFHGDISSFVVDDIDIDVSTGGTSACGRFTATINGSATFNNADNFDKYVTFYYSSNPSASDLTYLTSHGTNCSSTLYEDGTFRCDLTSLTESTTYYYVAAAQVYANSIYDYNSYTKWDYGEVRSFTTKSFGADVTTGSASPYGRFTATLNGSAVFSNADDLTKTAAFLYSSSPSASNLSWLKSNGTRADASLSSDGTFKSNLDYLTDATTYYYVAKVTVYGREFYGEVKTFTTTTFGATVRTGEATNINLQTATLNGVLTTSNADDLSKSVWFLYSSSESTITSLKSTGTKISASLMEDGSFNASLDDQSPGTKCYYVACAKVYNREVYGEVESFTFQDFAITTVTDEVTDIELFSVTLNGSYLLTNNGNLLANNGNLDVSVGFRYSSSHSTLSGLTKSGARKIATVDGSSFSASLSNLSSDTKYYYVAYVTVCNRTVYGEVKQFATRDPIPQKEGAVDLGLSVKWGACNLGALSPEKYGDYYSWGELSPKEVYSTSTYLNPSRFQDAAAETLHGGWRAPTRAECKELKDNCSYIWILYKGVKGALFTSKINGKSIFFPAAGSKGDYNYVEGKACPCWTSSTYSSGAVGLSYALEIYYDSEIHCYVDVSHNYQGYSMRPVCEGSVVQGLDY